MPDIEVHIDVATGQKRVGMLRRHARRGEDITSFAYHPDWLGDPARFSLEPALTLNRGAFTPGDGAAIFGSIADSAPDTWGRRLMQRAERRYGNIHVATGCRKRWRAQNRNPAHGNRFRTRRPPQGFGAVELPMPTWPDALHDHAFAMR